jgi:hypothetical protein
MNGGTRLRPPTQVKESHKLTAPLPIPPKPAPASAAAAAAPTVAPAMVKPGVRLPPTRPGTSYSAVQLAPRPRAPVAPVAGVKRMVASVAAVTDQSKRARPAWDVQRRLEDVEAQTHRLLEQVGAATDEAARSLRTRLDDAELRGKGLGPPSPSFLYRIAHVDAGARC